MEWVWGIIHIGVGFCNTHSLVKELVPPRCANGSNGTDTHPFCINPSHRGIGDNCSSGSQSPADTMNKTALARKIQALDGLSNEEKTALLELIRGHKKYGLVWEEKSEDIEERLREDLPVLVERNDDKVHPIISDNPDAPNHLIIEGDNLAALTELSYTHAGKIDVIYIDPPYNTGNKDFVYNDSFVDSEDSYRHSKWLSFMSRRLRVAKTLLSERGVIFISIDDNEQANLKLLCDEIFGVANFITAVPRLTKKAGKTTDAVAVNHDYVLIYSRLKKFKLLEHNDPAFKYVDKFVSERGKYKLSQTLDYDTLGYVNSLDYPIVIEGETFYPGNVSEKEYLERKRQNPKDGFRWRWSEELFKFGLANGFVVVKRTKNGARIYTKTYKRASIGKINNTYFVEIKERGNIFSSIQMVENDFSNDNARKELDNLFEDKAFSYPKPISLPKICAWLTTTSNSIIVDFFAGSGTTLHAVMQLNAEDGGKRQCILCTNNENGICENVTYERNKRVIEGYKKPSGEEVAGLSDNNLRYYRTEFLPRERSVKNMRELVQASTGLLCIKNDLYTEAPFGGRKMNPKYARYFENAGQRMLVIYEERAIPFIADIIKTMPEGEKIKVYVFSHGSYAYDDEFAEVAEQVTLCALPQAIYDAYQKVLPKRKPKFLVDELVEEIVENNDAEETKDGLFGLDYKKGGDQ